MAALCGLLLISYSRTGLRHLLRLSKLFIIAGATVIMVHLVRQAMIETLLALWTGVPGACDVDYYSIISFPTVVGFLSIIVGLFIRGLEGGRNIPLPYPARQPLKKG